MRPVRVWTIGVVVTALAAGAAAQEAPGSTPPPETETVTVTGQSAMPGEIARDEAIRDALRNAVEQAAGLFIQSQTKTENYQLVHDVILSRARGFVKKFTILNEKRNDEGVYIVNIKAEVVTKAVADDWLSMRALLIQKGMPRMMVHVVEAVDGQSTGRHTAQARFENILLKYGIPQVNQDQVKENDRRDLEAARLADDLNKMAAISGRYKADVVIVGKSRATLTQSKEVYGIPVHFYTGDVEMRAVRTANAKLLFSDSVSASQGDRNKTEAARQALDKAGAGVAGQFLIGLMDTWVKELSKQVGTDYDLEISAIKFPQIPALIKELTANSKLVTHCNLKDYRNEVAFLVVGSTTSTTNLALWMSTDIKAVKLEVTEVTPGAIKAKVAAGE